MKRMVWMLLGSLLLVGTAQAQPTPTNRMFLWDAPADMSQVVGYYFYYAPEAENPRAYSNVRRVQIADPLVRQLAVVDFSAGLGNLCGKVTAYNVQNQESDYSNEVCGFFGIPAPRNVQIQ